MKLNNYCTGKYIFFFYLRSLLYLTVKRSPFDKRHTDNISILTIYRQATNNGTVNMKRYIGVCVSHLAHANIEEASSHNFKRLESRQLLSNYPQTHRPVTFCLFFFLTVLKT